jgi:hypothetical protein
MLKMLVKALVPKVLTKGVVGVDDAKDIIREAPRAKVLVEASCCSHRRY